MPEPDFDRTASELATHFLATDGLADGWLERNELRITAALRQVWNARGAADEKLLTENYDEAPADLVASAIRSLDR